MKRTACRQRNRVERRVKRFRECTRVATRYEKLAADDLAMLTPVAIRLPL